MKYRSPGRFSLLASPLLARGLGVAACAAILGLAAPRAVQAQDTRSAEARRGEARLRGFSPRRHWRRHVPMPGEYVETGDFVPYGWVPAPYVQSRRYKRYPPPNAPEPRLGLHYQYPYAYQFGIQLPVDENPPVTYDLGPFRGVVRSPQGPAWLGREETSPGSDPLGIYLLREGKYRAAGLLQAEGFRDQEDPRYPLYLAESLFALGKYEHAELVLRHALTDEAVFDVLPSDVAAHFPDRDTYEEKVEELVAADSADAPLLTAYLLLFTRDGTRGLDRLREMLRDAPEDEVAARLYRHYLGKAFGPPSDAADGEDGGDAEKDAPQDEESS